VFSYLRRFFDLRVSNECADAQGLPLERYPLQFLNPLISTSSSGDDSRMLSEGMRLWPPARMRAGARHGAPADRMPRPEYQAGRRRTTALSNRSSSRAIISSARQARANASRFRAGRHAGREQRGLRDGRRRAAGRWQAARIETAGNDERGDAEIVDPPRKAA